MEGVIKSKKGILAVEQGFPGKESLAHSVLLLAGHIGSGPATRLSVFTLPVFFSTEWAKRQNLSALTSAGEPFILTLFCSP